MKKLLISLMLFTGISLAFRLQGRSQEKGITIVTKRPSSSILSEKQQRSLSRKGENMPGIPYSSPWGFRHAASKAVPGVVSVLCTYKPGFKGAPINPFSKFYHDDLWPNSLEKNTGVAEGSASGILLTSDGFIVTNYHVVNQATSVRVVLYNHRSYKARVLGVDSLTDLALLKITGSGLPFIPFGSIDSVAVGDWVLAIGNPFDLNATVTAGIISAKSRVLNTIEEQGGLYSFIQTDAVMNDGSSGGALVDINGNLIGVNTGIITPNGEFTGYSFSIPVEIVRKISDDLLRYGFVDRAYMGVFVSDRDDLYGVVVDSLVKNGGAMTGGIFPGDLIVSIDGRPVAAVAAFHEYMLQYRPGEKVVVGVRRNDKERSFQIRLNDQEETAGFVHAADDGLLKLLGIEVRDINKEEREVLHNEGGVRVIKVRNGKIYRSTNIEPGFIIQEVNGQPVAGREHFLEILKHTKGRVLVSGIYDEYPEAMYYAAFDL